MNKDTKCGVKYVCTAGYETTCLQTEDALIHRKLDFIGHHKFKPDNPQPNRPYGTSKFWVELEELCIKYGARLIVNKKGHIDVEVFRGSQVSSLEYFADDDDYGD